MKMSPDTAKHFFRDRIPVQLRMNGLKDPSLFSEPMQRSLCCFPPKKEPEVYLQIWWNREAPDLGTWAQRREGWGRVVKVRGEGKSTYRILVLFLCLGWWKYPEVEGWVGEHLSLQEEKKRRRKKKKWALSPVDFPKAGRGHEDASSSKAADEKNFFLFPLLTLGMATSTALRQKMKLICYYCLNIWYELVVLHIFCFIMIIFQGRRS